ncbi:MAG: hypothetical protein K6F94_07450 [Bacteroidaceae bacterium]|nr:hypothetical protein [Bacteroidaceae bacterium]
MKQLFILPVITLCLLSVACSEKAEDSYPPVYERMTFTPSTAHPGDSVTATVIQSSKGHGLASTDYVWRISYTYLVADMAARDTTVQISQHTNYDGLDNGNPTLKFLVPENCVSSSVTVRLNADFDSYIGYVLYMKQEKSGVLPIR